MILVLGGTTEGRKVVQLLEQGDGEYFYSTLGDMQTVECQHGTHISGAMTVDTMQKFCSDHHIQLIVDAAHPFASNLHATVDAVSRQLTLPVVRYERRYPCLPHEVVECADYDDTCRKMLDAGVQKLLALTGVQTIGKLRGFWQKRPTVFRILDREESLAKVREQGFDESRVVFYHPGNTAMLLEQTGADAIVTKESGESGGMAEKLEAALHAGVKIFVVKRPPMPDRFITVTGNHGLRKMVERYCAGFFNLRSGFTTGACATAAAKAAMQLLITGDYDHEVAFELPDGETMEMEVKKAQLHHDSATAVVVKDAGDDPDVTNGREIHVSVKKNDCDEIRFFGGEGVGRVTLPGTGLAIGEPAINPVPRAMISNEIRYIYNGGVDVTVEVPGGEELAARTFNSRIGIEGGISIIGTTGIVMPFSHEAFIDAIRKQIEVAMAIGTGRIVINSGARSERIVKQQYPNLPSQSFIHYGNAIGETIKAAAEHGVKRLTIGIMVGKAVKLAEGHLDTHSHNVTLNRDFLCRIAKECGCSDSAIVKIKSLNMARELWNSIVPRDRDKLMNRIVELCHGYCSELLPGGDMETLLISDIGEVAYRFQQ